jgi:hypothetical protein
MKDTEAEVSVTRSSEPDCAVQLTVLAGDTYAIIHMTRDTAQSVAESILSMLSIGDA